MSTDLLQPSSASAADDFIRDPILDEVRAKLARPPKQTRERAGGGGAADAGGADTAADTGADTGTGCAEIDILIPLRRGGFIPGRVIEMFVRQEVPFTLHVEPGPDLEFSPRDEALLHLLAESPDELPRIKHTTRIAHKRNRMLARGSSPFVYLADADVVFEERRFFPSMLRAFARHAQLGMVGLCYQETRHVACGSMMLRRRDFERIGAIRGTAGSCACMFLGHRIKGLGLRVIPLKRSPPLDAPA
ncbi:hypothetical protein [Haliangium ochraceum]|uniref:Glycosyl transferase family 2 n=1 Tax=Haliangium ochraceum (strain DSM 14365 / JCM 11303 / SMP-2) TaxID=502025 RepID=D0LWZ8_HALO1|nr:hypothetical protein [Haliangium ochraceum]ACY14245.1 hypothetical protein Hoch_1695 [Haliangium ochraceum DSM 14365]